MSRQKRRSRPGGGGSGKQHARAAHAKHAPGSSPNQAAFTSADDVANHLKGNGRLAVVFLLTRDGRIGDDAVITHGIEALGIVPVRLLPKVIERCPSLDTPELRQSIATYHAEQVGIGGRA